MIELIANSPSLNVEVEAKDGKVKKVILSLPKKSGFYLTCADKDIAAELYTWLKAYSQGKLLPIPDAIDYEEAPAFTHSVWEELQKLLFGKTASYAEIAARLSNPKAARAVGNACGNNPYPLFIPCHRVLRAGSKIGGFAFGAEVKRRLLNFEGINV